MPFLCGVQMTYIKVCLCGCHGSGKTTLVRKMRKEFEQDNKTVFVVDEVARSSPYKLGTVRAQSWIWHNHYAKEVEGMASGCDVVLCDRSLADNLCYLKYIVDKTPNQYSKETFDFLYAATREWMKTYDVLRRLPLNEDRILNDDDEVRGHNLVYAREIDAIFDELLDPFVTHRGEP